MFSSGHIPLLHASPIARTLARFLRWWGGELVAVVPKRLRTWWGQAEPTVFLSIEGNRATFTRRVGDRLETILNATMDSNTPMQSTGIGRQLTGQLGKHYRLVLSLSAADTLRRTLRLPLATEENLAQTLSFELDRYTPFKPDEVYFDFRILRRDSIQQIIEVDLALAKRTEIDRLKRLVATLGMSLQGLAFDGEILGGHVPPGWENAGTLQSPRRTWIHAASAFVSLLLLVILLGIPIWQKRATTIALQTPLAEARSAAKETDALRDQLDLRIAEHNALPDKKWANPSLVQVLDEVSLRLKDDTFLAHFSFDGKTIVLQGESGSGAELVEVLEASPLLQNVMFKSPLTKLQGGTHDRFHISADISPEGMPKPPTVPAQATP